MSNGGSIANRMTFGIGSHLDCQPVGIWDSKSRIQWRLTPYNTLPCVPPPSVTTARADWVECGGLLYSSEYKFRSSWSGPLAHFLFPTQDAGQYEAGPVTYRRVTGAGHCFAWLRARRGGRPRAMATASPWGIIQCELTTWIFRAETILRAASARATT